MSAILQITMKSKETAAEKTLYEARPSKKTLILWFLSSLISTLIIGVFIAAILSGFLLRTFLSVSNPWTIVYIAIGAFILFIFIVLVYNIFLLKTYRYSITSRGLYFRGGIFVKREKLVPFFKITNVEVTQGILEQMLKLKRLSFQTAGTGGRPMPEIVFEGLIDIENPKKITYHMIEKTRKASRYDE